MVAAELSAVAGFVLVVLLAWSPLLAVERIRALFVWPTRWVAANYLVLGVGVVLLQCLSYLAVIVLAAGTGPVSGGEAAVIVGGVAAANVLVPGLCAVGAVRVLPRRGVWTVDGGGVDGRVALGLGVVWYAVVTTVVFVLAGLALMFANLPT